MQATTAYLVRFCAACRSFQLNPSGVLQAFASSISIHGLLYPETGSPFYWAGRVFLSFHQRQPQFSETDEGKRERAIRNIRSMLDILHSDRHPGAKQTACQKIAGKWHKANGLPPSKTLVLDGGQKVALPANFLLHADLMHYKPEDLLDFLIGEIANGIQSGNETCSNAGCRFLMACVSKQYAIENN